ncbi:hypothetical protein [Devosia sp. CAU 1758]
MDSTKIIRFPVSGRVSIAVVLRRFENFPRFARSFYDPPASLLKPAEVAVAGGLNDNQVK